jgi:hypothetical protein
LNPTSAARAFKNSFVPLQLPPTAASTTLRLPGAPRPLAHRLDVQLKLPSNRLLAPPLLPQSPNRSPCRLTNQIPLRGTRRRRREDLKTLHPFLLQTVEMGGKINPEHGGNLGAELTCRGTLRREDAANQLVDSGEWLTQATGPSRRSP